MRLAFAFDLDGVILDSLPILKKTYLDFLATYGQTGTEIEFLSLNGPSLPEIVYKLQRVHQLPDSSEDLLKIYRSYLHDAYIEANLVAGAKECLRELKSRGFFLALVTSSLWNEVDEVLKVHRISDLFDFVLAGDEFRQSKPSPEIYLKLREKFPQYSFLAIEDSLNGLISAMKAGLRTIYFDPHGTGTDLNVDCRISSLFTLGTRVNEFELSCCVIERANNIEISLSEGYFPEISVEDSRQLEAIWRDAQEKKSVVDESVLYYHSHKSVGNNLVVKAFWGSYRYFFAKQIDPSLGIPYVPLAVSGICVNDNDQIMIGRRRNVLEYSDCLELVPSGGITRTSVGVAASDFRNQIIEEFVQETGLDIRRIRTLKPLGLVKDFKNQVVDICFRIQVQTAIGEIMQNTSEYEDLAWVEQSAIKSKTLIPTSCALLNLFEENKIRNVV